MRNIWSKRRQTRTKVLLTASVTSLQLSCLFPRYEQDQPNVDIHINISVGHKPVFQPIFAVTLNYVCNAGSPGFTEAIAGVHMTTSKF